MSQVNGVPSSCEFESMVLLVEADASVSVQIRLGDKFTEQEDLIKVGSHMALYVSFDHPALLQR